MICRSHSPLERVVGRIRVLCGVLLVGTAGLAIAEHAEAQAGVSGGVISISLGQSYLLVQPVPVSRVSIGDPEIADAVVVSPREVLVNGRGLGSTTLITWDQADVRRTYTVEVTVDAAALQRTIQQLFPGEQIQVSASGNLVILSGTATQTRIARQVLELARATGATVVDNLTVPAAQQIMLQVRIAEASRTALSEFASQLQAFNPQNLDGAGDWTIETISDGIMRILLVNPNASIEGIFRALRSTGEIRTLAEPNLVALEGSEASFLAGGEFPYPSVQGTTGAVTIQWREFGVRLNFAPLITGAGVIRLRVAPEVSSLDFTTGLVVGGFAVPSILSRRSETEIELRDGQTFAISGLLDNRTQELATRIPVLGDLPIIGALFRSRQARQERTELLVLVTPRLVAPVDHPLPVPTGEPDVWRWDPALRPPTLVPGTTTIHPVPATPGGAQ